MACPAQLDLEEQGLEAGGPCSLQYLDVGDEVAPVYMEDGAKTALVKVFKEAYVAAVQRP